MSDELTAYCMKCREKREILNPEPVFTKSARPATKGECSVCGTTLFRMGETEAHAGMTPPEPVKTKRKKTSKKARSSKSKKSSGGNVRRRGKLVIVESPAKAKTIENYLGSSYKVRASVGHVRDLLKSQLSVDVENNFEPRYRVPNDKRDVVKELIKEAARAKEVYLATDPDREGEAIAWHLISAVGLDEMDIPVNRVVFYEVTKDAVLEAFEEPRPIDLNLVNAQQTRRILDRLVGYELSPLLWDKVRPRLSAGRVQSVAVRLIVEREREIDNFVPVEYWTIDAELATEDASEEESFVARLVRIRGEEADLRSEEAVRPILEELENAVYNVSDIKHGQRKRNASAPFTTSTMQQEASRRINFTTRRTMSIAQQLYEGVNIGSDGQVGLITYMRTDSTNVSSQAQSEASNYIREVFGEDYLPDTPNIYGKKSKNAQEAHEAIRPTSIYRTPEAMSAYLNRDQLRLYTLIWQRFVASQMAPALYDTMRVEVAAGPAGASNGDKPYLFRASGSILRFAGFLAVYEDKFDEDNPADEDEGRIFPELTIGELLALLQLLPEQHFTQPPPRYSEATLVKALEEYGIGRPSTYAPILQTVQQRGYVEREAKRLVPTDTGYIVNDLLVDNFQSIVDLNFTARMEDRLDDVANGEEEWVPLLSEFYDPFHASIEWAYEHVPSVELENEKLGRDCPSCGTHDSLIIRYGRYGKFIGCANFPECRYTEPWLEKMGIACPVDGGEIVQRKTKKGRTFYGCSNYPECEWTSWKQPVPEPCPVCNGLMIIQNKEWAKCTECGQQVKLSTLPSQEPDSAPETA